MTRLLSAFQDAFITALYDADKHSLPELTAQAGFSVYRNTVLKGAVDALLANFPTVERLVGRDWFVAAASVYAHQSPPVDARLIHHGADFADFLDHFEHARELPYLGNVARLDRLWIASHSAVDQPGIDLAYIASLNAEQLTALRLTPRASARWAWFDDQPAFTLWRHNREHTDLPDPLDWHGEGALLVRSHGVVGWQPLDMGGCAFLDACAAGHPLALAAQHAEDRQPGLDILELLTRLVSADVFALTDSAH
ncbi:putative DNA-binding domain-containing protein [Pseudomonas sp. NPDC090202]|uniref:HvfC/BufC family peptide modification chaperone n=1 Tax=unclassified Pseudomonas TaxID=196821 RepID=UPI0037F187BF